MFRLLGLLSAVVLVGPAFADNPDPRALVIPAEELAKARQLVGQLGDPLFAAREQASRELAGMGRKALAPLAVGEAQDPDPEVRLRCHKLVPDARADDLERFPGRCSVWVAATAGVVAALRRGGCRGQLARVVFDRMQPVWASGRVETVLRWMTWLEQEGKLGRYPAIAVHGSLIFALLGRPAEAERWAAIAQQAPANETLPDGSTMGGLLAYLRARQGPEGLFWNGPSERGGGYASDCVESFCQSRAALGLVTWLQATGANAATAALDQLVAGLDTVAVWDGDAAYFPGSQWRNGWLETTNARNLPQRVSLLYKMATGGPKVRRPV